MMVMVRELIVLQRLGAPLICIELFTSLVQSPNADNAGDQTLYPLVVGGNEIMSEIFDGTQWNQYRELPDDDWSSLVSEDTAHCNGKLNLPLAIKSFLHSRAASSLTATSYTTWGRTTSPWVA